MPEVSDVRKYSAHRSPRAARTRLESAPVASEHHVRHPLQPPRRDRQAASWQGPPDRGRRRRGPPRDPHRPARGRRQRRRRPRGRHPDPRRGDRRHPLAGARPEPAGRQDRQRRADTHPRRRDAAHHLRRSPTDRRADGRTAGLRQDHGGGQARPLVQGAGPQPVARRRRPPATRRRRAAAHARPPDRRPGVLRAGRPRR